MYFHLVTPLILFYWTISYSVALQEFWLLGFFTQELTQKKDPVEVVGNPEVIVKEARKKKKVSTKPVPEVTRPVLLKAEYFPSNTIFSFNDLSRDFDYSFDPSLFKTKSENRFSKIVLDSDSLLKPLPPVKSLSFSKARSFSFCNNLFKKIEEQELYIQAFQSLKKSCNHPCLKNYARIHPGKENLATSIVHSTVPSGFSLFSLPKLP